MGGTKEEKEIEIESLDECKNVWGENVNNPLTQEMSLAKAPLILLQVNYYEVCISAQSRLKSFSLNWS